MINRNSKNEEILKVPEIKAMLDEGKVVVIDKIATKNDSYVQLYLMQYVEVADSSSINSGASFLLGFNKSPQRAIQNSKKEIADKIEIGQNLNDVFGGDFTLQIKDSYEPNPDYAHTPRATSDGDVLVCRESGSLIYREVSLTSKDECNHNLIKVMLESDFKEEAKSVKGVSTNKLTKAKF